MAGLKIVTARAAVVTLWVTCVLAATGQDRVYVKLKNAANGKVLDGTPHSVSHGTVLEQDDWRWNREQWALRPVRGTNGGYAFIINRMTSKRLAGPLRPRNPRSLFTHLLVPQSRSVFM